jgi:hypothetical protein
MQPIPRKLTTDQKAVLIQVLLAFPNQQVGVCFCPSATDALAYAHDFLTVFKVIGWKVNEDTPSEVLTGRHTGLAFLVSDQGRLPSSAEALRDALRIYGIEISTVCESSYDMKPDGFVLAIGPQS